MRKIKKRRIVIDIRKDFKGMAPRCLEGTELTETRMERVLARNKRAVS